MASSHTALSLLSAFLLRLPPSVVSNVARTTRIFPRELSHPLLPTASFYIPAAFQLNIPTLLGDIWESVLRAVPKKKTSYMKKRSRYMAGKGLKDVTSLNKCSACGNVKRQHFLCPYCVNGNSFLQSIVYHQLTVESEIKQMFKNKMSAKWCWRRCLSMMALGFNCIV